MNSIYYITYFLIKHITFTMLGVVGATLTACRVWMQYEIERDGDYPRAVHPSSSGGGSNSFLSVPEDQEAA